MGIQSASGVVAGALILALTQTGCASVDPVSGPVGNGPPVAVQQAASSQPAASAEVRVVRRVTTEATLRFPVRRVEDLLRHPAVDLIVEGAVSDVAFELHDGMVAETRISITAESCSLPCPSPIQVWEGGGLVPVSDIRLEDRERMGISNVDVTPDAVIDFAPVGGAKHPRIGDRVLLFLMDRPGDPAPGHYFEVGDAFGRFTPADDGSYVRAANERGFEAVLSQQSVTGVLPISPK